MPIAPAVAITGLGLVTPLAVDVAAHREALAAGTIAVGEPPPGIPPVFGVHRAGAIRGFDPEALLRQRKNAKFMGRSAALLACAGHLAVRDAALDPSHVAFEDVGLFVGTGLEDRGIDDFAGAIAAGRERADAPWDPATLGRAMRAYDPDAMLRSLSSMLVGHTAIELGVMGPNAALTPSWIAGGQAIAAAMRAIAEGTAIALAGAADGKLDLPGLFQLDALGVLARAPADDGIVVGEGAVVLVLEAHEHARARGARIYGWIRGVGESTKVAADDGDRDHPRAHAVGYLAAMRQALRAAGLAPDAIAAIRSDASGLAAHARAESAALAEIFGAVIPPASAYATRTGHMLAATLPFELAMTLLEAGPQHVLCAAWGPPGQYFALVLECAGEPR